MRLIVSVVITILLLLYYIEFVWKHTRDMVSNEIIGRNKLRCAYISFGCSCTYVPTIIYYFDVIFSSHVETRSNYTQVRTYIICLRYLMTFDIDYYSSGWRKVWYLYCAYPIYIVCKIRYMQKHRCPFFLFYLVLFLCFSHP